MIRHKSVVHVAARVVSLPYLLLYLCLCAAGPYMLLRCFVVLLTRAPFCADIEYTTFCGDKGTNFRCHVSFCHVSCQFFPSPPEVHNKKALSLSRNREEPFD